MIVSKSRPFSEKVTISYAPVFILIVGGSSMEPPPVKPILGPGDLFGAKV